MTNRKIARELLLVARSLSGAPDTEMGDAREHVKEACEEALKALKRGDSMERYLNELSRAARQGLKVLV